MREAKIAVVYYSNDFLTLNFNEVYLNKRWIIMLFEYRVTEKKNKSLDQFVLNKIIKEFRRYYACNKEHKY